MSCHSVSLELGQPEWDKYPDSKLHMILPKLNDCVPCPQSNRSEREKRALLSLNTLVILAGLAPFIDGDRCLMCASHVTRCLPQKKSICFFVVIDPREHLK